MVGYPPIDFDRFSIKALLSNLKNDRILINKEYQRSYIWKPTQRRAFIDSIMKGFSIGVLVIWINKKGQYEILDGQQRIETIKRYCNNKFANNDGKKFEDLSQTLKSDIEGYSIYYLELKSVLNDEQVSDIFTRLQEGTPLNIAEKVNALRGEFRKNFMFLFQNEFFSKIYNRRFRARLLAAQLLLLELETNLDKRVFPSMTYTDFKNVSKKYKTVPKSKVEDCNRYMNFLKKTLDRERRRTSFRDWISFYLLASYLHKKMKKKEQLEGNFRQFASEFIKILRSFSIYDKAPPRGVDPEIFRDYMNYKQVGRKATSADSIEKRFDFILSKYKQMFPFEESKISESLKATEETQSYKILKELENQLRGIIQTELQKITRNWWKERVPPDVRKNAETRKSQNKRVWPWYDQMDLPLITYIDFPDYVKIIRKRDNWRQVFKKVFIDEEIISSKLKELEPIRNSISHNRELTSGENRRLELNAADIIATIKKARQEEKDQASE